MDWLRGITLNLSGPGQGLQSGGLGPELREGSAHLQARGEDHPLLDLPGGSLLNPAFGVSGGWLDSAGVGHPGGSSFFFFLWGAMGFMLWFCSWTVGHL